MSTVADSCGTDSPWALTAETQFFKVIMGSLVFFMQAGFTMLEAGSVGSTATTSILFKNMLDTVIGSIAWLVIGFALAYGDGDSYIVGYKYFMMHDLNECEYAFFFFQWGFAATSATIVSGAMAGRTKLAAYTTSSVLITGFMYPCIVHWVWSSKAWLAGDNNDRLRDFAGSGVVHVVGGSAGLVGAWLVGPRGTKIFEAFQNKSDIPAHSVPLAVLGTLILFFGFLGFNAGSVQNIDSIQMASKMSRAVVNTVLAGSSGALAADVCNRFIVRHRYWSMLGMCNGALAGMVAICASADNVYPWAALIIGAIGGCTYKCWSLMLPKFGIDDAIDAVPVHMGAGIWGLIACALFAKEESVFYDGNTQMAWKRLGWALCGVVVITGWSMLGSFIAFSALKKFNLLRESDDNLEQGLDIVSHGESAYVFTQVARDVNRPWGPNFLRAKGMVVPGSAANKASEPGRKTQRTTMQPTTMQPNIDEIGHISQTETTI